MLILAAWLHDIDPFMIQFTRDWGIRWYGMSYLLGFFLGYLVIKRVARVGVSTLKPQHVADLIVTLAVGVVVGGRLGYVFFYRPELLWTFHAHLPFWGVLAVNQGGMASHGGMIGGIVAAWYYAWRYHHDLPFLLDLFAFGAPLGLFFGRIANFINGELFGRACDPNFPLAVKFPQELREWSAQKLEPIFQALAAHDQYPWPSEPVEWIIRQIQHHNHVVSQVVAPFLTPRHPSQLYEAVGEGLVVFAGLLLVWRKPRYPGVLGSWFCIFYGIVRIVDEFWRRPDYFLLSNFHAMQNTLGIGISRGQWLSAILVCVGLWGLWYSRHRAKKKGLPRMGGWRKQESSKMTKQENNKLETLEGHEKVEEAAT